MIYTNRLNLDPIPLIHLFLVCCREKNFYDDIFSGKEDVHQKFRELVPKYYGTCVKVSLQVFIALVKKVKISKSLLDIIDIWGKRSIFDFINIVIPTR